MCGYSSVSANFRSAPVFFFLYLYEYKGLIIKSEALTKEMKVNRPWLKWLLWCLRLAPVSTFGSRPFSSQILWREAFLSCKAKALHGVLFFSLTHSCFCAFCRKFYPKRYPTSVATGLFTGPAVAFCFWEFELATFWLQVQNLKQRASAVEQSWRLFLFASMFCF